MSDDVATAANVEAPRQDRIFVEGSVTSAAALELATGEKGEAGDNGDGLGWYTFHADGVDVYLIFGDGETTVNDPVPTAVDAETGRCWKIRADQEKDFKITRSNQALKHIESATGGFLRYYRSEK